MTLLNPIISWFIKKRIHQIELFCKYPEDVQYELLFALIKKAKDTSWGKQYDYKSISSYQDYISRVPISSYEDLYPHINQIMKGHQNVLWPTKITWFAKSSGTTNARSKFIPVSKEALKDCHFKAGKDMLSIYLNNYPNPNVMAGRTLSIGGSHQINELNPNTFYGDVSAVLTQNLPWWAQIIRTPSLKTALLDSWESKIDEMIKECTEQNVTGLAGVPTWTIILIQEIVKHKKVDNILDIWPNLELFVHGAVAFGPYEKIFKELIPNDNMNYLEVYNASEGCFGIQDQPGTKEMLLMLDYGVFYEFIPMEEWGNENPKTLTINEVEVGKNYAVVITTNSGLWRYAIGDTIKFTSRYPFRIKVSGRTKHFINAYGEEVIVENADAGIQKACDATGAVIEEYTAGPKYFESGSNGRHEWIIEFKQLPVDLNMFIDVLDKTIREINSDYDAKRQKDLALKLPIVHVAPKGTFYKWMKKRNKLGGQHKVPRLANNREYLDEIVPLLKK